MKEPKRTKDNANQAATVEAARLLLNLPGEVAGGLLPILVSLSESKRPPTEVARVRRMAARLRLVLRYEKLRRSHSCRRIGRCELMRQVVREANNLDPDTPYSFRSLYRWVRAYERDGSMGLKGQLAWPRREKGDQGTQTKAGTRSQATGESQTLFDGCLNSLRRTFKPIPTGSVIGHFKHSHRHRQGIPARTRVAIF